MMRARVLFAICLVVGVSSVAQSGFRDKLKKANKSGKTAKKLNAKISEEQERSLGRAVSANLIGRFGIVDDPKLTSYVAVLGNYLASLSTRPELPYRFAVLQSDEVNAYAAPGGFIFITRGALAAANDESELAAILAHEVVHVAERHGVKSIEDSYRKKVVMSGLAEAAANKAGVDPKLVEAFGELSDELTEGLLTKGLSRKLELGADRGAVELLLSSGYDPEALPRFLTRLASASGGKLGTIGRTHPQPDDRAKEANKAIKKSKAKSRPETRYAELFAASVP